MCILVLCQEYFTKQTIEEQIKYPDNVVTAFIDLNVCMLTNWVHPINIFMFCIMQVQHLMCGTSERIVNVVL